MANAIPEISRLGRYVLAQIMAQTLDIAGVSWLSLPDKMS